ncbi:porphobilinogen synthase [Kallotenue papyrolyticum]|uniref:porphobilinogen synthase n=1 Tax=Kallotenue papyrolyticum TaxID=1325125 RepID=UPI000471F75D|nr:porphobilinogen synthase [Kallotenue papyrolyticum]
MSPVPVIRPRRLRRTAALRRMVRETTLTPDDLIYPLFVTHGRDRQQPIGSMPGQFQWSVDRLPRLAEQIATLGIPAVILFGLPASKDAIGSENFAADGIVQQAIRAIKAAVPELVVITDVCMCEYTDHGHCGIVDEHGYVVNDATLDILGRVVVSHAAAGADIVAPSGMIDGAVAAIRAALDRAGAQQVAIMAYAAKFASSFYGPFREAADSPPRFGDRTQYQMDPANGREALRELALDAAEGADILMVKPALPYLDVLSQARQRCELPLAAYHVSGEYAMIKAAAANGWIDERNVVLESLTAIKRAGADLILTYYALDAARWLRS